MQANRYENRIVTLPNALSLLRILMIPVFVWLYCAKKAYHWSAAVVVATGLTDVLDGILARKLHMEEQRRAACSTRWRTSWRRPRCAS